MTSITRIEILQGDWSKTVEYYYHNIILRENCDNYEVSIDIRKNYNTVYTIDMAGRGYCLELKRGSKDDIYSLLEDVFMWFNIHKPEDFEGHSLSVSDVINIYDENKKVTHYMVCSIGFLEVDDVNDVDGVKNVSEE